MTVFAALQSGLAGCVLARHGVRAGELDTVYVVENFELADERVLGRSDAVIFVLKQLGGAELRSACPGLRPGPTQSYRNWGFVGNMLQLMPRAIRDWGYGVVARNRYRIFGRFDSCVLPGPENRGRFLDV